MHKLLLILTLTLSTTFAYADQAMRYAELQRLSQPKKLDCSLYNRDNVLKNAEQLRKSFLYSLVFFSNTLQIISKMELEEKDYLEADTIQQLGFAFKNISAYHDKIVEKRKYFEKWDRAVKDCPDQEVSNKLSAHLYMITTLSPYVQFHEMFGKFIRNKKLKKILNNEDVAYGRKDNDFYKHMKSVVKPLDFKKLNKAVNLISKKDIVLDSELQSYYDYFHKHLGYMIRYINSHEKISKSSLYIGKAKEEVYDTFQFVFEKVSTFIGMAAYRMVFGTGELLDNEIAIRQMKESLEPLDILLYNAPFKLNAKLIPGYWGHSSMWFGTEEQLRELDMWDHPYIIPYHDLLRDGRNMLESMNLGVNLYTLESSLNIDNLGVFRKKNMTRDEKRRRLMVAIRQIGKEFDFGFDALDPKKLVCSEVIYQTFGDLDFTLESKMGKMTFTPNQIMLDAFAGKVPLKPVMLFLDGVKVQHRDGSDPSAKMLTAIMKRLKK